MTPMTGPSSHFYRSKTFRRALDWRGVHKLQEFWISYRGVTIKHTWSIWSKMISWWFEADKNYPWKIWPLIIIHSWNPPINQSYKKQLCFFFRFGVDTAQLGLSENGYPKQVLERIEIATPNDLGCHVFFFKSMCIRISKHHFELNM
jgi:hypothetical protein